MNTPRPKLTNDSRTKPPETDAGFVVADLYTGAFLLAQGCRLQGLVPVHGGRFGFSFLNLSGEAERLASAYNTGASVEAVAFASAVHDLKTRIFAARSQHDVRDYNATNHRRQFTPRS